MSKQIPTFQLLGAMTIFGTVGIFVHFIPMSAAMIALCRAVLGFAFLAVVMLSKKRRPDYAALWRKLWLLLLSGAALGANWILLFEAYRYTSVASATACYYLAPVFLVLVSPLLKERLTPRKLICAAVAFFGAVLVSGVLSDAAVDLTGIAFALGAAVLYAAVMFSNKLLTGLEAFDKTAVQLFAASLAVLPYALVNTRDPFAAMDAGAWVLLAVVGVVHTGLAYYLYFGSVKHLPTQSVAVMSYLDPVVAIGLSAAVLHQPLSIWNALGAILILGSTMFSELSGSKSGSTSG